MTPVVFVPLGEWTFDFDVAAFKLFRPVDSPLVIRACLIAKPVLGRYMCARRLEGWHLSPVVYLSSGYGKTVPDMPFYSFTGADDTYNDRISDCLTNVTLP